MDCPHTPTAYTHTQYRFFEDQKLTCVPSQEDVVGKHCGRLLPSLFNAGDLLLYTWLSGRRFSFCSMQQRWVQVSPHVSTSDHEIISKFKKIQYIYIHSVSFTYGFPLGRGVSLGTTLDSSNDFDPFWSLWVFFFSPFLLVLQELLELSLWKDSFCALRPINTKWSIINIGFDHFATQCYPSSIIRGIAPNFGPYT